MCCGKHVVVVAHVGHGVQTVEAGAEVALTVEAILGLGMPLIKSKIGLIARLQAQVDLVDGGVHRAASCVANGVGVAFADFNLLDQSFVDFQGRLAGLRTSQQGARGQGILFATDDCPHLSARGSGVSQSFGSASKSGELKGIQVDVRRASKGVVTVEEVLG